jgi:alanine-alpha-ketoisovalerate/valine-pyruvate aminotransferase
MRTISHHTCDDFLLTCAIVNTLIAPKMDLGGEASSSRFHFPDRNVCKFQHAGSNVGKIPKMLWKMLQELGYEKQLKYYGTQVTYEGSESVWHVQVNIFTPKPLRGVFEVKKVHAPISPRHTFYAGIHDAVHQAYLVTHSCHR